MSFFLSNEIKLFISSDLSRQYPVLDPYNPAEFGQIMFDPNPKMLFEVNLNPPHFSTKLEMKEDKSVF